MVGQRGERPARGPAERRIRPKAEDYGKADGGAGSGAAGPTAPPATGAFLEDGETGYVLSKKIAKPIRNKLPRRNGAAEGNDGDVTCLSFEIRVSSAEQNSFEVFAVKCCLL